MDDTRVSKGSRRRFLKQAGAISAVALSETVL
jgi:hypothetical protein